MKIKPLNIKRVLCTTLFFVIVTFFIFQYKESVSFYGKYTLGNIQMLFNQERRVLIEVKKSPEMFIKSGKKCKFKKGNRPAASMLRDLFEKESPKHKNSRQIKNTTVDTLLDRCDFSDFKDYSDNNILHFAIYMNDAENLGDWINKYKHLLDDVNGKGFTPVLSAVMINAPNSVLALLNNGADTRIRTNRAKITVIDTCREILLEDNEYEACNVLKQFLKESKTIK